MRFPLSIVAIAAVAILSPVHAADVPAAKPAKKILFFSKSAGFEHSVIKRMNDQPSFAEKVLSELGTKSGFEFTFSKDGSLFTPEYLSQFDAFVFYTTGDLGLVGKLDRSPAVTPAGKEALFKAIDGGKGFVGVHSASDTYHSPGNEEIVAARFVNDGERADPFVKLLGGEFIRHGAQQKAKMVPVDTAFPGMRNLPADFVLHEEWYSLKNFTPDLHVLLVQDTTGMKGDEYQRPNFPATWARMQGKGRIFYTSMGHREDVWTNPVFQEILTGGLDWASRRVDADVKPNFKQATPGATEMPVYREPTKKPEPTKAPSAPTT